MAAILADTVLILHLAFIVWVAAGGLAVLRWRRLAWVHLPVVAWGALVELAGWICPLTPLEMALRRRAGDPFGRDSFLGEYLLPLIYPGELTRGVQVALGVAVLAVNAVIYTFIWLRSSKRDAGRPRPA